MARSKRQAARREEAIARYLELRPAVRERMEASVSPELRAEFVSITADQLRALMALPPEGLPMRTLASTMHVMGATASVLADRLSAQGLARRDPDPVDRRVVRLVPTPAGLALAERNRLAQRHHADALFSALSDDQVASFLDIIETLATSPIDPPGPPTAPPPSGGAKKRSHRATESDGLTLEPVR